jgi:hypothetical protein
LITVTACVNTPAQKSKNTPFLNQDEFTGLQTLGNSVSAIQMDYALDSPNGKEIPLNSCAAVKATSEEDIDQSQLHLLQLIQVNCTAAEYYFSAVSKGNAPSAFPAALTESFVKSLPGIAVPDLGGESLENREGTLAEVEPNLKVLTLNQNAAELSLEGGLVINYIVMARGDFDGNGCEDLLLRLDWHISTAFGKGFDLIMLSQTSEGTPPHIIWRN